MSNMLFLDFKIRIIRICMMVDTSCITSISCKEGWPSRFSLAAWQWEMRENRPAAVLLMSRKHLDKVGKMEENWTENEHQKGFIF